MDNPPLSRFFNTNPNNLTDTFTSINSDEIKVQAETNILNTFHNLALKIPAYKNFLHKNKVDIENIKTIEDFKKLPILNKENYINEYSFKERCLNGDITDSVFITSSSGSSGKPCFWPWSTDRVETSAIVWDFLLNYHFDIKKNKTLILITYGLGVWAAGTVIYTLSALSTIKGNKISAINVGLDSAQCLTMLREISPLFEQTLITGYPGFIKDTLEIAQKEGVNLKGLNIKILTAGEKYTLPWRKYINSLTGTEYPYKDLVGFYASSEVGVIGFESPFANYLRDLTSTDKDLSSQLFADPQISTLVHYNPLTRFVESIDESLVFSLGGGMPLFRYDSKDIGKIIPFNQALEYTKKRGVKTEDINKALNGGKIINLPLFTVNGRKDNVVTLYAVNIYQENIEKALINEQIFKFVTGRFRITGKFALRTTYTKTHDQCLNIDIELAYNIPNNKKYQKRILDIIVKTLRENNSEYNKLYLSIGNKAIPKIKLYPFRDTVFISLNKHKYMIKGNDT